MISSRQVSNNLCIVFYNSLWLEYFKDSEYINATGLCKQIRKRNCLIHWKRNQTTIKLMQALNKELKEQYNMEDAVCFEMNGATFIHPSLAPHLATWLGVEFNYPVCQMLKHIIATNEVDKMSRFVPKQVLSTHSFTFFELHDPKLGPMKQYKAVEGLENTHKRECDLLCKKHAKATVIFQQLKVPDNVRVVYELKEDFKNHWKRMHQRQLVLWKQIGN